MSLSEATLDDVFLRQTGRSLRDAGAHRRTKEVSMKTARDTRLLFQRYTLQLLRNPVWLFVGFSTPVLYLLLFTPLLKSLPGVKGFPTGSVLQLFLPGILSLLAFTSGAGAGFNTIFELQSGLIERLRVTPASRLAILVGPILSGLLMMTIFDIVVIAIAVGFGFTVHWAGLLVLDRPALGARYPDGRLFDGDRPCHQGHQQLRRHYQRDEPTPAVAVRRPAADRAGAALAESPGPFQPALLPGGGGTSPGCRPLLGTAVWQAFAVLIPLCALVLTWATRVFRRAVS